MPYHHISGLPAAAAAAQSYPCLGPHGLRLATPYQLFSRGSQKWDNQGVAGPEAPLLGSKEERLPFSTGWQYLDLAGCLARGSWFLGSIELTVALGHWLLVNEAFLLGLMVRVSLGWPLAMPGTSFPSKMASSLFQGVHSSHSSPPLYHSAD